MSRRTRWILLALLDGDAASEASAADEVEAQATRLVANVLGSQRLALDGAVTGAVSAFAATKPNALLVAAYNRAVRHYEDERTGTVQQPVARVLGYDTRPALALGAGAAA